MGNKGMSVVVFIITISGLVNMMVRCDTKYQHISEVDRRSLPGVVSGVG